MENRKKEKRYDTQFGTEEATKSIENLKEEKNIATNTVYDTSNAF